MGVLFRDWLFRCGVKIPDDDDVTVRPDDVTTLLLLLLILLLQGVCFRHPAVVVPTRGLILFSFLRQPIRSSFARNVMATQNQWAILDALWLQET